MSTHLMNNTNRSSCQHSFRKFQQGLTLIEVMVAITISLFLLGGVIQIFSSNKQVYRVQDASARIQESGRFGLYFLTTAIRNADYWGCSGEFPGVNNHLNAGTENPFDLSNGGIGGTDGGSGPDTLLLIGGSSNGIGINSTNLTSAQFFVTDVDHGISTGDYLLATDCENADLLQATSASPGTNINITANTGTGTPGNLTKPGFDYTAAGGSRLFTMATTTYSLALSSGGTESSLYRTINGGTPQELVEGVQDMQILYGEDTDDDGAANRYLAAGTGGLVMTRVVSIHVTLTIRSEKDFVSTNLDTSQDTNGDYRLRRTFTSTTTIRNRVS